MAKVRVWYVNGGVSITVPAPNSELDYADIMAKTEAHCISAGQWPVGSEYEDVDESEVPNDRKYRNAWRKEKGKPFTIDATVKAEIDAMPTDEHNAKVQAKLIEMAEAELAKEEEKEV